MVVPGEKLLLVVIIRSPSQYRADVHALAANLTDHVVRQHALGRVLIMSAARRMDVVVAGIPAIFRWISPSLELELDFRWPFLIDCEFFLLRQVLRAARVSYGVLAFGQAQGFSVRSVNLRLKKEIRSKALGGVRIKTILLVANNERRGWQWIKGNISPAVGSLSRRQFRRRLWRPCGFYVHVTRIRTLNLELRRHTGVIYHLNQKEPGSSLDQLRLGRAGLNFHATFRI